MLVRVSRALLDVPETEPKLQDHEIACTLSALEIRDFQCVQCVGSIISVAALLESRHLHVD